MLKLKSFVSGEWHGGEGKIATLLNPATEEPLAETSTSGIDFSAALVHARDVGGPALRAMTFAERAEKLQGIYDALFADIYPGEEEIVDEIIIRNMQNTHVHKIFCDWVGRHIPWIVEKKEYKV